MRIIDHIRKDWLRVAAEVAAVGSIVGGVAYGFKTGDWIIAANIVTFGIAGSCLFYEIGNWARENWKVAAYEREKIKAATPKCRGPA
jgi:hypothetical protein